MAEQTKPLPLQWNQLCLEAIQCSGTSPPLAARALAMVHTAMYDAWSVYDERLLVTRYAIFFKQDTCRAKVKQLQIGLALVSYNFQFT